MPVRFYKLSTVPILKALPRLVEKIYESRQAIHIYVPDKGLLKTLNDALWTYTPLGFLPHGVAGDSYEDQQPILLSSALTIKNNAEICVCTDPTPLSVLSSFKTIVYVYEAPASDSFDGLIKECKDALCWEQSENGAWQKKES